MLATADCTSLYKEQTIYDTEWNENPSNSISWLNLLTAQPIPEETDGIDNVQTPIRSNSERSSSSSSSSSVDSCYVVLEIQRPRLVDETSSKVEDNESEEEEEEEEEEVEIEELNFAQTKVDEHIVDYEQLADSITTEFPMEEHVIESRQEHFIDIQEYAKITQPTIQESPDEVLFHNAKAVSRYTKRMKAMGHVSKKERQLSTSSDDEVVQNSKPKPVRRVNEYHPTAIPTVTPEQELIKQQSNSSRYSTTSLDSIENRSMPSSPIQINTTTTFSNLPSQRPLNPIQIQRSAPTMGTTTLTRTFAFDRACMEKYGRVQESKNEIPTKEIYENISYEETKSSPKTNENTIINPPAFYIDNEISIDEEIQLESQPSIFPPPPPTSGPITLTKTPSLICLMKKYARTVTNEYRLAHDLTNEKKSAEPTLLEVKYLDGRLPLKDNRPQDSFKKGHTLTGSIASRLNRLGLTKMSSTQDLSSGTSFNNSYRARVFNRFRNFIENNSSEHPPPIPQSRPWQHKTVSELYHERKEKVRKRQR